MDSAMAPGQNHLFIPGPSNIPFKVMQALNRPNEDHRSPAFPAFSKQLLHDLKQLFRTQAGTPFIIPTTGTGGWESAATNTLSTGDKVLIFVFGQFSHLWSEQLIKLHFQVEAIQCDWGSGINFQLLNSKLHQDKLHQIKALCIVHNETSTGVHINLPMIRASLDENHHPALLLVDGVSSIGALEFQMDEWGVDVALTGSQKSLGLPTGLGIICASPRAIEASRSSNSPRGFFDWAAYLKCYELASYWPYTPSIHLLYGLRAALDLLLQEGLNNVVERHHRLAQATRLAVEAWGLKLCAQDSKLYSDTVTAVLVPPHMNSTDVVRLAWKKYNLSIGVGLSKVAGKVFRIGHIGFINELQLLAALAGVEMVLKDVCFPVKLGSGVAAAQAYLAKNTPLIASRL